MPNYFLDNSDLLYHFEKLNIREVVSLYEDNYKQAEKYSYAPVNYEDAIENYRKILEVAGDLAANYIAPTAAAVDEVGATFHDGKVTYAEGTQKSLEVLAKAELMGMIIPREYEGLNFPTTIYMMSVEMISRADASLMNIYGLQDIARTLAQFGDDGQKEKYLPKFSNGEYTGAMALTEPDAGSDLQAVKLSAYQDEKGNWFLRGVKRFITNGNGEVLLVLARTEVGTKDARGLSMLVCKADETVIVRRIEHKLGINGSPTCELQFNDTPAELVGSRRFGLLKYVIYLMNRARVGIGAQSLGIAQAAYEEALNYAKAREQFGTPIYNLPVIANMLIEMKTTLEAHRSLFYDTCVWLDRKEMYEIEVEKLKAEKKSVAEMNDKLKEASRILAFLTPLTKFFLTEGVNKIAYDAMQIHGGTGYMKEFSIERLFRDARITNIYEGTTQLQIVAASGGVLNDAVGEYIGKWLGADYKGSIQDLLKYLLEMREVFSECLSFIKAKKDTSYQDIAMKELVEMYGSLYVGCLLLREANEDSKRLFTARRFVLDSHAKAIKNKELIMSGIYSDILHSDTILI